MALVSAISLSVVDDRGKSESIRVFVPATATLAQIQAYSNVLVAAIEDTTGGYIEGATVTVGLTLPAGTRTEAANDMFNTTGANLGFSAENTTYRHTLRIPAIIPALTAGGEVVADDALLIAVRSALLTGDGTLAATDEYGNGLDGFIGASMSFRTK